MNDHHTTSPDTAATAAPATGLMRTRALPLAAAALLLAACTPSSQTARDEAPDDTLAASSDGVRFAIEVEQGAHEPVFVYLNTESQPVGWVTVTGPDGRVALEPRCDVPDCGQPAAVCGAAMPRVRRVADADGAGTVEYDWNGMTSEIGTGDAACERRVPARPGAYTARFCYAHDAELWDEADPAQGAGGRLGERTCVEQPFRLGEDREVVLRLPR